VQTHTELDGRNCAAVSGQMVQMEGEQKLPAALPAIGFACVIISDL
jgi:hypothetical protein